MHYTCVSNIIIMNIKNIILILVASVAFTISSCGKYDEGPGISLSSKTGRVANAWKLDRAFENGIDLTLDYKINYPLFDVTFTKEGSYEMLINGNRGVGTWLFDKNKEKLILTQAASSFSEAWSILRLTQKELWITLVDGNTKYEWHFQSK